MNGTRGWMTNQDPSFVLILTPVLMMMNILTLTWKQHWHEIWFLICKFCFFFTSITSPSKFGIGDLYLKEAFHSFFPYTVFIYGFNAPSGADCFVDDCLCLVSPSKVICCCSCCFCFIFLIVILLDYSKGGDWLSSPPYWNGPSSSPMRCYCYSFLTVNLHCLVIAS